MARGLQLIVVSLVLALLSGCPRGERRAEPAGGGDAASPADGGALEAEAAPPGPTCEERLAAVRGRVQAAVDERRECRWDVDCVVLDVRSGCAPACGHAVSSAGVVAAREAVAEVDRTECDDFVEADCERPVSRCAEQVAYCIEGRCTALEGSAAEPERPAAEVPPQNSARRSDEPPRPPAGDADERARRLFDAIVHDDPARAMDFFFPREAFREVKGIAEPDRYYARLLARYLQDIHDLHEGTADLARAEFVRFELVRRGGWVPSGEEANRLPYWACRHSWIYYRVGEEERRLEVRVLITWGERWYITHLSEFR